MRNPKEPALQPHETKRMNVSALILEDVLDCDAMLSRLDGEKI